MNLINTFKSGKSLKGAKIIFKFRLKDYYLYCRDENENRNLFISHTSLSSLSIVYKHLFCGQYQMENVYQPGKHRIQC